MIDAIFSAGWGRGVDLGEPASIAALLDEAGLDGAELIGRTTQPEVKAELRRATDAAIERGVFGVPTVLVGDELFFGNDRLHHVQLALQGIDPVDEELVKRMLARPASATRR